MRAMVLSVIAFVLLLGVYSFREMLILELVLLIFSLAVFLWLSFAYGLGHAVESFFFFVRELFLRKEA
jgi:hypothetical protein